MSSAPILRKFGKFAVPLTAAAFVLLGSLASQSVFGGDDAKAPKATGQVTFLYYEDLGNAANFYGNVMGFENIFDEGWVKFFAITPTSSVGLVDESRGFHKTSDDKPVMLSVVTDDVESWYKHLKNKDVKFIKHLDKSTSQGFVYSFLVEDPGGYTVEVFEWK